MLEQPLELVGLVAVARDDQRPLAAQVDAQLGAEGGKSVERAEAELEQGVLAELRLGDRREHAGGVAPGAVLAGVEHDRAQAALRGPPGDGEADDAAADDRDVVMLGLRRRCHFPPYAGTSRIRFTGRRPRAALSARWRAPVRTIIVALQH